MLSTTDQTTSPSATRFGRDHSAHSGVSWHLRIVRWVNIWFKHRFLPFIAINFITWYKTTLVIAGRKKTGFRNERQRIKLDKFAADAAGFFMELLLISRRKHIVHCYFFLLCMRYVLQKWREVFWSDDPKILIFVRCSPKYTHEPFANALSIDQSINQFICPFLHTIITGSLNAILANRKNSMYLRCIS